MDLDAQVIDEPPGRRVVRLDGELDIATAPQVTVALDWALTAPGATEVVVDMTHLSFIDATGITVFVKAFRLAKREGRSLRACGARGEVDMVLRVTDVADLLGLPQVPAEVATRTEEVT